MSITELTFNATGEEDAYKKEKYGQDNDILHINLKGEKAISLLDEIREGIDVLKPGKDSTITFTLFGVLDKENRT